MTHLSQPLRELHAELSQVLETPLEHIKDHLIGEMGLAKRRAKPKFEHFSNQANKLLDCCCDWFVP